MRRWAIQVVWLDNGATQPTGYKHWTRWGARRHLESLDFYRVMARGEWRYKIVRL